MIEAIRKPVSGEFHIISEKSVKKTLKITRLLSLGMLIFSLQGCLVAAVGAGVGAWKWGDAKKAEVETQCKKDYPAYFNGMEKINQTKVKRHEKADAIMTLEEYCHLEKNEEKALVTKG